jgi:pimeloyl-ACP methyl ester carboxylesterase
LRELPLPFCHEHEDQHRAVSPYGVRTLIALRHELSDSARLTLVGHSLGASLALSALPELLPDLVVAFNGSFAETSDLVGELSPARAVDLLRKYGGATAGSTNGKGRAGLGPLPSDSTLAAQPNEDWQWLLNRKPRPYAVLWITEQGEVLADAQRLLAIPLLVWRARGKATHPQRSRVDVDLNVLGKNPVSQHGIEALACQLLRLPSECEPDQRFTSAFGRLEP